MSHPPAYTPPAMRLLAGIAIQPLLTFGLAFVSFPLLLLDQKGRSPGGGVPMDVTDAAVSVAFGASIVAVFVSLLGALPTVIWLTKSRRVPFNEALLFGAGFGNFPFLLGTALAGSYGIAHFVRGVAFSSLLGLGGAAAFWAIALRPGDASSTGDS